jgi:Concanavalin A-like lectin/glucanases superfamily
MFVFFTRKSLLQKALLFVFCMVPILAHAQVPTNGLVAYYPFNGNANDESGNGNHGTVNGATLTTDRFGNANRAYNFNGTTDFIDVADSPTLDVTSELTLSVWINEFSANLNVSQSAYNGRIIEKGYAGQNNGYLLDAVGSINSNPCSNTATTIKTRFIAGVGVMGNSCYSFNNWHHLIATFNQGLLKVYIDGVLDVSYNGTVSTIPTNNLPLRIGYTQGAAGCGCEYFRGEIDDIRIYNRALSESEVQQLYGTYTASAPPVPTQLSSQIIKMGNASNAVFLLWQTTTSAKSYEIYRDGQLVGRNTNPIFRELLDAGTYSYQVVAVNDYGKSVKSQPLAVVVAGNSSDIHYGKLAIYIHTEDKNPIENAVITFTDGSDPIQTNKNGLALIESLPYGTAKTIASITKSGWTFEPEAGAANNYAIKIDKALHLIRVKGTAAANNTNTNSSYIPPYKADLLVYDVNAIVYPTFTKGNNYELKVNVRASSLAGWQGDIRLIAVRKDVLVNKEAPTFYIGQLTDSYVSVRGTELTFKAIDGKLNADVGKYELYIQTLSPQAYKPSYHNIAIDAATEASVTYGQIFVKEIIIDNNSYNFYGKI